MVGYRKVAVLACALLLAGCGSDEAPYEPGTNGGTPDASFDASEDLGIVDVDVDAPDQAADAPIAPNDAGMPEFTIGTYPRVDGSTSTLPLAYVIACELLGLPWKWEETWNDANMDFLMQVVPDPKNPEQVVLADQLVQRVVHHKTHAAYTGLIQDETDLILVASLASPEEQALANALGIELDARPVAWDALVFLVNKANPVSDLTAGEVRAIFMGNLVNWNSVGGSDWPVSPYVRPPNSGSQQLMETVVMDGLQMPAWPESQQAAMMGALIDMIEQDAYAIGYSVYYYVTHMVDSNLTKTISVDGFSPTLATIGEGVYPFRAPVWVVTRTNLPSESQAAQLRDWLLSPGGQDVVYLSEYVPVGP